MGSLSKDLLSWYLLNKRDLPWRKTRDPYKIWLTEIIFQQTRIDQGLNYYLKFEKRFSDVHALAKANEEEILKLWQGLGYYSRARNLHYTAKLISSEYQGHFPDTYEGLKKLKGVGDYTAAAIASIAFDIPVPVVDGNVFRVISRLFAIKTPIDTNEGKKIIRRKMEDLMLKDNPGDFNQAVMEFGALHCTPLNPACANCVLKKYCLAYEDDLCNVLPIKSKIIKSSKRYFHYLVLVRNEKDLLIRKRIGKDIWRNLYDFPMLEYTEEMNFSKVINDFKEKYHIKIMESKCNISKEIKHVLTHRKIFARFYYLPLNNQKVSVFSKEENFQWIPYDEWQRFPFPQLIVNYLVFVHNA